MCFGGVVISCVVTIIAMLLCPVISVIADRTDRVIIEDIPVNVTIAEKSTAILPCTVADYKDEAVVWMNPKKIVVSKMESRFINDMRISIERPFVGDYNLHIREVKYEDRGDYTCIINSHPMIKKTVRLIVNVPSKILNYGESDSKGIREVDALEGTSVELTCNATGVPIPTVTWFREVYDIETKKEAVGTEGEILMIRNISRHCGGIYECMAFNNVPPAVTQKIRVKVEFKPEVKVSTRRIGQVLGGETILRCIITASPQGSNMWLFGSKDVSKEKSYKYTVEVYQENKYTVSLSLRIKSVELDDYGWYNCTARNIHGSSSSRMELYEYVEPKPMPDTHVPPFFTPSATPLDRSRITDPEREDETYQGSLGTGHFKIESHCSVVTSSKYIIILSFINYFANYYFPLHTLL